MVIKSLTPTEWLEFYKSNPGIFSSFLDYVNESTAEILAENTRLSEAVAGYHKLTERQRREIKRLKEVLRRYYIFEQFLGEDKLYAEFGAPEFPESSISCEEWLERVLREPARAVLESE